VKITVTASAPPQGAPTLEAQVFSDAGAAIVGVQVTDVASLLKLLPRLTALAALLPKPAK
jgi:hypothetical protein